MIYKYKVPHNRHKSKKTPIKRRKTSPLYHKDATTRMNSPKQTNKRMHNQILPTGTLFAAFHLFFYKKSSFQPCIKKKNKYICELEVHCDTMPYTQQW